jgi:radical SAM superfamily enzyme YgiQ (UPF0313 family)
MKITLINPPFEEQYSVGASRSIKYVLNVIPPLGLAYLAAVLEKQNFQVNIIDCSIETSYKNTFKKIIEDKPQIIGITATTPTFEAAKFMAKTIKETLPKTIVIIGGAHVSAVPYQTMESNYFDIGVLGEAEETFLELVQHIKINGVSNLDTIKGLIFKENGKYVITARREFIKNLDEIPHPARHLLPPLSRYRPTPASYKRLPLGVIITSRGCPHQCTFCDRSVFGNIYRQRSANDVLGEVEELIGGYGAKEIRFFDDCFTLDKERTYQICAGMKKIRLRIPWTCLTTVDSVSEDLLQAMKSAGCWQVLFGLESGDERMLKLLKKGVRLEQNIKAITWAKEAGLSVRADFIVGTPGETEGSLEKTLDFALKMKLDYAHFNKFVPYPGTELYRKLKEEGYDFDFSSGCSITDHSRFLYVPETITEKSYYRTFPNYAHKRFYLRLGYILKRLLSIKTWDELKGQIKGLLAISLLNRGLKQRNV